MEIFSINKNSNSGFLKDDIRFTKYRLVVLTISQPAVPQSFGQKNFILRTLAFYCLHVFAALLFGQNIHWAELNNSNANIRFIVYVSIKADDGRLHT